MPTLEPVPLVTVVMPVYNEERFIRRSLGAVLAQDYPPDRLEVLVMDGLSTDRTADEVRALAGSDPRVRLLTNPGRLQAQALNLALGAARGEIVVRVDGHTVIAPDYVSRCVEHLRATGAGNVGGPQRFAGLTPLGHAIAAAYRSPFSVPSRFTISQQAETVDTVYMGAWPRAVLERLGGFDATLEANEDYELNYRLRQAGWRIFLAPDIRSEYYGRQTWGALWRQFFRYGRWKWVVIARHPASTRPRHLAAPAFVAGLIGGALLAPFNRWIARGWALLLAAYGAASLGFTLRQAARTSRGVLLRLPLVFACMHLAWGSGFWREALRWLLHGMKTGGTPS